MIKWIRGLIANYEIYFAIGLAIFFFGSGVYVCHVFHKAGETEQIKAELQKHIELETVYHNSSSAYQKLNQTLQDDNNKYAEQAQNAKDPICGSKSLPQPRLHVLKGLRATAVAR